MSLPDYNLLGLISSSTTPISASTSLFSTNENSGLNATSVSAPLQPATLLTGQLTSQVNLVEGYLQSSNFISGLRGWQIDADGNAEFNSGTFRGKFVIGGTLITVTESSQIESALTELAALGGGTLSLAPGTYDVDFDILLTSGITFDGNGSTIDFGGINADVRIESDTLYQDGTVDVNFGSTSVSGTGTAWDSTMVGQSILIGDYWYLIDAVGGATSLTIDTEYIGLDITGSAYTIATPVTGVTIRNVTLQNSSGSLIAFSGCNGLTIDTVYCFDSSNGYGVYGTNSALVSYLNSTADTCKDGVSWIDVHFGTISGSNCLNIVQNGFVFDNVTNTAFFAIAVQNIGLEGVRFRNCTNLGFDNFSIIQCGASGINLDYGNTDLEISGGYINTCGTLAGPSRDGILLTFSSDRNQFSDISSLNNGTYGFNVSDASCDNNIFTGCTTTGNGTAGFNDAGTGTLASAAVNSFI